jgi:peptide/nickel transport system permease protein
MSEVANTGPASVATKYRDVRRSQLSMVLSRFRRHKLAVVSAILLAILLLIAALGNLLMPYDPTQMNQALAMGRPQPPSAQHWLGTDEFGRDTLSRAISGAQVSLTVGFVSVGIALLVGVALGCLAGYYGGRTDNLVMRLVDVFMSVPDFFLILTVNAYLKPSIYNVMVVIGLFSWMGAARLVRGEFLRLKELDFITAARMVGVPPFRLASRHLLINAVSPIIVFATLRIPQAILTESALSFLGLGVQPPQASWGSMLFAANRWLNVAWWLWLPPGLLISLTVLAFNFAGDGLRDALDPVQKR